MTQKGERNNENQKFGMGKVKCAEIKCLKYCRVAKGMPRVMKRVVQITIAVQTAKVQNSTSRSQCKQQFF